MHGPRIERDDRSAPRILFAADDAYLPDAYGGCGVNTHALCRLLQARGASVAVLAKLRRRGPADVRPLLQRAVAGDRGASRDEVLGYPVFRARTPTAVLERLCRELCPDVVIVQSCGQLVPLAWRCLWLGIPAFIYLHNTELDHLGGDCFADPGFRYAAISAFVGDRLRQRWDLPSDVVLPLVQPGDYRVTSTREVVTFVNPRPHKGVEIAWTLAGRRPDIAFEFVESWPLERPERQRLLDRLRRHPNVLFVPASADMRSVYARSRLVLVPSQCDEAWGRIV